MIEVIQLQSNTPPTSVLESKPKNVETRTGRNVLDSSKTPRVGANCVVLSSETLHAKSAKLYAIL